MMGERKVMQKALFYSFRIEYYVPADHLLRAIDRFVDLSGLREHLEPFYSSTGRPSIDPVDDPNADRRLLHGHKFRAAVVRGCPFQPRLPLVLSARS